MGNRYVTIIALACLGIVAILSLSGSPRVAQVLAPLDTTHNPVSTINNFYSAVERGDWLRVRALTTPEYWKVLEEKGQQETWKKLFLQDPSLKYQGFQTKDAQTERTTAVVNGWVQWSSALGNIPRNTQIITLEEGLGGWRISSIQSKK